MLLGCCRSALPSDLAPLETAGEAEVRLGASAAPLGSNQPLQYHPFEITTITAHSAI